MSLSDLPREILLDITDHLGDAATNALARTNHQVYSLLNPYLYRRDVIKPKSKSLTWAANIPDLYDDAVTNALARTDLQGSNLPNQYLYRQLDLTRPQSRSLNWVIRNGVEGTIRLALDAGRYLNPIPESFNVALQLVVQKRCLHFVQMLLNVDGIDPNYGGGAALISATKLCQSGIVRSLLAADNINPNVRDQHHKTPLHSACEMGYVAIVRLLLARDDVDPNAGSDRFGTPLIAACYNKHVEIINLLLAKDGIDVNFIHNGKNTAISIAVGMGSTPVVKSLLARDDLNLNIVQQALVSSAYLGDINIVKLLLNYPDIDPNSAADHNGFTALMWAIRKPDIVKLLLDQEGIDVNRQNSAGRTALCLAAYWNHLQAAELLLGREELDINIPDNQGRTALSWACHDSRLEIARLLLERDDIDPNCRDNNGWTPLALACRFGTSVAIVRRLLDHLDTDPNAVDNFGINILADFMDNSRHRQDTRYGITVSIFSCGRAKEIEDLLRAAGATRT